MEPENLNQASPQVKQPKSSLHQVTPLSKYLAMALFIILPFVGGYIGYTFAPEKVVEVERVVEPMKEVSDESFEPITKEPDFTYEPIVTTIIDMVSYRIRYTNDAVELLDGPNIVQTIPWDTTFRKVFTDDNSLIITNYDVNYDHYLDVGILSNVGYGGSNRFYHFYTFNPTDYRLEKVTDFDTFEGDISEVVNPSINIAERTLTSSFKSGQEWRYIKYQFDGDEYIQSEEWSEGWRQETEVISSGTKREPEIIVLDYELQKPASIEIEYKNMPLQASGLALCIPSGPCTEWVDSTFSPNSPDGIHVMESTKGLAAGEYTIMVIGGSFTDQLFLSEPFNIK